MQRILFLALALSVASCASTIQSASISEAYKKYEVREFEHTLELIIRAENVREVNPEMKAELAYLKAQAHEGLGQFEIANVLYQYLSEEHSGSPYGYLALGKLNSKSKLQE